MIRIGKTNYRDAANLPNRAKQLAHLIFGGEDWLAWACPPTELVLEVANENALGVALQNGLHNTGIIPFSGFDLAMEAIVDLSDDDVALLVSYTNGASGAGGKCKKMLNKHGYFTAKELREGSEWRKDAGLDSNMLFRNMGLGDHVQLYLLSRQYDETGGPTQDVLEFATDTAATVVEFTNLVRFGVELDSQLQSSCSGGIAPTALQSNYQSLCPLTYGMLYAPYVGRDITPEAVKRAVRNSRLIGFSTSSAALSCIANNFDLGAALPAQLWTQFNDWLMRIRQCVIDNAPKANSQSQDGSNYLLEYQDTDTGNTVWLQVSQNGYATLMPTTEWPYKPQN